MQVRRVDAVQARGAQPSRDAGPAQPGQLAAAAAGSAGQAGDDVRRQRRGRHLGIPVGDDQPDRGRPQRLAEVREQAERGLIGAVQVIDDDQLRRGCCLLPERVPDALVQAVPGGGALGGPGGDPGPAEVTQHLHPRPQRRGALALPAGAPRHHRAARAFGGRPGQPGLADTGLPGEQHDPAGPGFSLRDQRIEDGEFRVPADERAACCVVQGRPGSQYWSGEVDRRRDGDLRRSRRGTDRPDEGLQVGVGEELLEVLDALPFVDDHDEPLADPEPVVNTARGLGHVGDLRELTGPVGQSLAEHGGVALEFPDDQHTHA